MSNTPTQNKDTDKTKTIKADYALQHKVGAGPLNQNLVARAEQIMSTNSVDFVPLAMEYLNELKTAIDKCKNAKFSNKKDAVAAITAPVMQLKANAKTFGYDLIGDMAGIMLSFMETIKEIDKTVIEIVSAHHATLHAIVIQEIKGNGGDYGQKIQAELKGACQRYIKKIRNKG